MNPHYFVFSSPHLPRVQQSGGAFSPHGLKVAGAVDEGEDEDIVVGNLVHQTVVVDEQLADGGIFAFGNDTPAPNPQSVWLTEKNHPRLACCNCWRRVAPSAIACATVASSKTKAVPLKLITWDAPVALLPIDRLAARGPAAAAR